MAAPFTRFVSKETKYFFVLRNATRHDGFLRAFTNNKLLSSSSVNGNGGESDSDATKEGAVESAKSKLSKADDSDTIETKDLPSKHNESVEKPGWAKALDIIKEYEDKIAEAEIENAKSKEASDNQDTEQASIPQETEYERFLAEAELAADNDVRHHRFSTPESHFEHVKIDLNALNKKRDSQSFATLLKNSNFVGMGSASDSVVIGTIILKEGPDLYIDFGGKFHCVCPDPEFDRQE